MTMVNLIGSHADDQVVAPQLAQGVNFADYLHLLQTFTGIDAQKAATLAEQLQEVQDLLVEPDVVATIAETNGVEPKKLALAMQLITKRSTAGTIPGAATIAQQPLNGQTTETYANMANFAPITPTAVAPQISPSPEQTIATLQLQMDAIRAQLQAKGVDARYTMMSAPMVYKETPEQELARLKLESDIYQKRLAKWELLNPLNAVTTGVAKRKAKRINKAFAKSNFGDALKRGFSYPVVSYFKNIDPATIAGDMQKFEQQHGPATRASLPTRARPAAEQYYNQMKQAYTTRMTTTANIPPFSAN